MTDLDNILHAARERVCELGNDDHGHTDCWIIGGLLNEIDRLNKALMSTEVQLLEATYRQVVARRECSQARAIAADWRDEVTEGVEVERNRLLNPFPWEETP